MKNDLEVWRLLSALAAELLIIWGCVQLVDAQPKRPFNVYQSGGNCVYIVDGKYASFVSVVPVGPGGC